jgi:hypothetical protein
MSATNLERRIDVLPKRIGLDHVFELREAIGKRVAKRSVTSLRGSCKNAIAASPWMAVRARGPRRQVRSVAD